MVGDSETEGKISVIKCIPTRALCYSRIGWNSPYQSENNYSYYLRFNVSIRLNNLNPQYTQRYSDNNYQLYKLIRSLRDEGLSYRRISKHLNDKNILTPNNKKWGVSGNSVYSVLKRYKERGERLELRNKRYEPVRSKMWLEYS